VVAKCVLSVSALMFPNSYNLQFTYSVIVEKSWNTNQQLFFLASSFEIYNLTLSSMMSSFEVVTMSLEYVSLRFSRPVSDFLM